MHALSSSTVQRASGSRMAGRSSQLKFVDHRTASQYRCIVCFSISKDPWRAQCCEAIYCQSCTKQAKLGPTASQDKDQPSSNGTPPASCSGCGTDSPQFLPDTTLQKKIGQLKVECPYAGCTWVGILATAESHSRLAHHSTALVFSNDPEIIAANNRPEPPSDYRLEQISMTQAGITDAEVQKHSNMSQKMMGKGQRSQESNSPTHSRGLWKELTRCCKAGKPLAEHSTSAKLLFLTGFVTAILWLLLVIPTSIIVLIDSVNKLRNRDASLIPTCDYSIALLWLVVLAQIAAAVCLVFWFSRCCKCSKKKRVGRAMVAVLSVVVTLYAVVVFGFALSVFPFVNDLRDAESQSDAGIMKPTNNTGSGDGSGITSGSSGDGGGDSGDGGSDGSGDHGDSGDGGGGSESGGGGLSGSGVGGDVSGGTISDGGNMTRISNFKSESGLSNVTNSPMNESTVPDTQEREVCIEVLSEPFIISLTFLLLLFIFFAAMSCMFSYECCHNGICHQSAHYDPTVLVFENETSFLQ